MAAGEEKTLLEEVEDILRKDSRITNSNRLTLIEFMKKNPCLWSNTQKYTKEGTKMAINELAMTFAGQHNVAESLGHRKVGEPRC